jgi:hypothetical protein
MKVSTAIDILPLMKGNDFRDIREIIRNDAFHRGNKMKFTKDVLTGSTGLPLKIDCEVLFDELPLFPHGRIHL